MIELKSFDPATASQAEFEAYHQLITSIRLEEFPDDLPRTLEFTIKILKSFVEMKHVDRTMFCLWKDHEIIARLSVLVHHHETNQHLVRVYLDIHKNYRRQGKAKLFLAKILEIAEANNRNLILGETLDTIPEGEGFALHLGARRGLDMHVNQLRLSNLDDTLIQSWLSQSALLADYELGCWDNEYPDNEIEAIAELMNVMNSAPRDNLNVEDDKITPERLREMMALDKAHGTHFWCLYIRHRLSGQFVGLTETSWNPDDALILWQGNTGVLPAHRGHGLGKWLKAAMINKIRHEHPEIRFIRTGNADSNASMLAINQKLGFEPYFGKTTWQLEVETLRKYLASKSS